MLIVVQDGTGGTRSNARDVLGHLPVVDRPVLVPVNWGVNTVNNEGHAGLLVVHTASRTFAVWDPSGEAGMSDEMLLEGHLHQDANVHLDLVPGLDHRHRPALQGALEAALRAAAGGDDDDAEASDDDADHDGAPPRGICMFTTALVLLCALRFDCPNPWFIADAIGVALRRMPPDQVSLVARNLVVAVRDVLRRCRTATAVAGRLGLWRPPLARRRHAAVGVCHVLDLALDGVICPEPSAARSPLCPDHLARLLPDLGGRSDVRSCTCRRRKRRRPSSPPPPVAAPSAVPRRQRGSFASVRRRSASRRAQRSSSHR